MAIGDDDLQRMLNSRLEFGVAHVIAVFDEVRIPAVLTACAGKRWPL